MQAAFRLIEYHRAIGIHHFVGDFHSAMRGQAVHEDGVRRRAGHEFPVYLVGREYLISFLLFMLVTHAGPGISIDRVNPVNSLFWVVEDLNTRTRLSGNVMG